MEQMPKTQDDEVAVSDAADDQLNETIEILREIDEPKELCECAFSALEILLRRDVDHELLVSLSESVGEIIGKLPFDAAPDVLEKAVRAAAAACIGLLRTAQETRPSRHVAVDETKESDEEALSEDDEFYYLPPNLAHLLKRLEYISFPPREARNGFASFQELYEAAILDKVYNVLVFFHKRCASTSRELPPPFILSSAFAANLQTAIEKLIFPHIGNNRQVRILAPGADWTKINTQSFWTERSTKLIRRKILQLWSRAWDDLKLLKAAGEEGVNLVQIKESTKLLRVLLAPQPPGEYDIPRIGNAEILFFESLLSTPEDWQASMDAVWQRCQDLYEQEIDPRVFQQKAREGALRDGILAAFKEFPEQWGDFLLLLCHYVFPRISTRFLDQFSASLGTTDAQREARMPYLMRYLRQVRAHPEIKAREVRDDEEWKSQAQELKNFLTGRAELEKKK